MLALIVIATIAIYLPRPAQRLGLDRPAGARSQSVNPELVFCWELIHPRRSYGRSTRTIRTSRRTAHPTGRSSWCGSRPMRGCSDSVHPAAWHLAKIALHVLAVLLCFRVAQLLTGDVVVALLAAAIFGLMPAHVEPVVWASAIPEPLSTVFELIRDDIPDRQKTGRETRMVARAPPVGNFSTAWRS